MKDEDVEQLKKHLSDCTGKEDCPVSMHRPRCKRIPQPEQSESRSPIYPVSVIEVACRALEAIAAVQPITSFVSKEFKYELDATVVKAIEIIRDGLASHEKAMRGKS